EAFRGGSLAQPTLALTSLIFVALGAWMIGDSRTSLRARLLLGATTVAVGVGSFLGHAGSDNGGRTIDSLSIKMLVSAFLIYGLVRRLGRDDRLLWPWWAAVAGPLIAAELVWPVTARPLLGLITAGAAVTAWLAVESRDGRRRLAASLSVFGLGLVAFWAGRAESSLCSPESVLQLHGLWHILAAMGIAFTYSAYRNEAA
ncbi:MAG: ceramidase domain-containing protein, partial [Acidimicrobiia bacterium]|nr:ceramidase domain-containing protein [Acidimicrobiia bacterium]